MDLKSWLRRQPRRTATELRMCRDRVPSLAAFVIGCEGHEVPIDRSASLRIPAGWLGLDPRRREVRAIWTHSLFPLPLSVNQRVLLQQVEAHSVSGPGQILISTCGRWVSERTLRYIRAHAHHLRNSELKWGHARTATLNATWVIVELPRMVEDGVAYEGALFGHWVGLRRGDAILMWAVVPGYEPEDQLQLEEFFNAPLRHES